MRAIGRALIELGRGFGLIVVDIHRFLYRRLKARVWWMYIGVAFIATLAATGQLLTFLLQVLTMLVFLGVCLYIGKAALRRLFGGGKG